MPDAYTRKELADRLIARRYFEERYAGYDLETSDRGFYLNKFIWREWQCFYAGFRAARVADGAESSVLSEILHGKEYE